MIKISTCLRNIIKPKLIIKPKPYIEIENIKFITGLGTSLKETAVAGLLQVTCKEPLKILKRFCLRELNITKIKNSASLQCLQEEIPPFLDMLEQIRKEEKADFLPRDVSTIVLMLLRIRSRTFTCAQRRENSDYTEYDGVGDHPTAYYPDFPLRTYPQTYTTRCSFHTS